MKFTAAAVIAIATGASAWNSNVTVTTEVVNEYTTYCPYATQISHGSKTWTVTAPTTLTITDCPCTLTRPVTTSTVVACTTCGVYNNSTLATVVPVTTMAGSVPTTGASVPPSSTVVPHAGAGKAAALSGAGLAGLVGLAAFVL